MPNITLYNKKNYSIILKGLNGIVLERNAKFSSFFESSVLDSALGELQELHEKGVLTYVIDIEKEDYSSSVVYLSTAERLADGGNTSLVFDTTEEKMYVWNNIAKEWSETGGGGGSGSGVSFWQDSSTAPIIAPATLTNNVAIGTLTPSVTNRPLFVKGSGAYEGGIRLDGSAPRVEWFSSSNTATNKSYDLIASGNTLNFRKMADDFSSVQHDMLTLDTSAVTVGSNLVIGNTDLGGGSYTVQPAAGDNGLILKPNGDMEVVLQGSSGTTLLEGYDGSDGGSGAARITVYGSGFTSGENSIFSVKGSNGNEFFKVYELTDDGFSYMTMYQGDGSTVVFHADGESSDVQLGNNLYLGNRDLGGGYYSINTYGGDSGIKIKPSGDTELILQGAGGNDLLAAYDSADGGSGPARISVYGNGFTSGQNDVFAVYNSQGHKFFEVSEDSDDNFTFVKLYKDDGTLVFSADGEGGDVLCGNNLWLGNHDLGGGYYSINTHPAGDNGLKLKPHGDTDIVLQGAGGNDLLSVYDGGGTEARVTVLGNGYTSGGDNKIFSVKGSGGQEFLKISESTEDNFSYLTFYKWDGDVAFMFDGESGDVQLGNDLWLGNRDLGGGYYQITAYGGDSGIKIRPKGDTEVILQGAGGNDLLAAYDSADGGSGPARISVYGNGFTNGTNEIFSVYGSNGNRFFSVSELTDDGFSYLDFYDGSGTIKFLSIDGEEGFVSTGYLNVDINASCDGMDYVDEEYAVYKGISFAPYSSSGIDVLSARMYHKRNATDAQGEPTTNRYGLDFLTDRGTKFGMTKDYKVFVGMPDDTSTTNRFEVNWKGYSKQTKTGFAGVTNPWFGYLFMGGIFTGTEDAIYDIQVVGIGSPNQFQWRKDGGSWNGPVNMTGSHSSLQNLDSGIRVGFGGASSSELQVGDTWTFTAYANIKPLELEQDKLTLNGTGTGSIELTTDADGWNYIVGNGGGTSQWLIGDNDDFGGSLAGGGLAVGTLSAHSLGLGASDTLRVVIDSAGGIAMTPTSLTVNGNTGWSGTFTNGDGATVTVVHGIITDVS